MHTQKTIAHTDDEFRISINVIISPELQMQILSYGDRVKVIKHASLAKTFKGIHQKAAEKY